MTTPPLTAPPLAAFATALAGDPGPLRAALAPDALVDTAPELRAAFAVEPGEPRGVLAVVGLSGGGMVSLLPLAARLRDHPRRA